MNLPELVIAGLIPDSQRISDPAHLRDVRENLEYAISHLTEDFFEGPHRNLFNLSTKVFLRNQIFVDDHIVTSYISAKALDSEATISIRAAYSVLEAEEVKPDKFKHLADALRKEKNRGLLSNTLAQALEKNAFGDLSGALDTIKDTLSKIEDTDEVIPAMEAGEAAELVVKDYYQTKSAPTGNRILSGFDTIDRISNGWQNGELIICGAFAGQGKSQFALNVVYHAKIVQKKNSLVFSLEMPVQQYGRRFLSRHSLHPKFGGDLSDGLPYNSIKNGALSSREEKVLEHIKNDLKSDEYGKMEIIQMGSHTTVDDLVAKAAVYSSKMRVDLIVIDYITLLQAARKRNQDREEFAQIIKDIKQFAMSFDKGRGVPILSLSQISREQFTKALKIHEYSITSFAETSEVERSSDMALWLLRGPEEVGTHKLKGGVVKYRDNNCGDPFELCEQFSHSKLSDPNGDRDIRAIINR